MRTVILAVVLILSIGLIGASAQDDTPMISVRDQISVDGTVTIAETYSEGPGFIVIHIDNEGQPGPVAGFAAIPAGRSENVVVEIDTTMATPTLYAMLHEDTGEEGVYEFGTVEGADGPVSVDGSVVTPSFPVILIDVDDQFVSEDSVTVKSAVYALDGWVVVHSGDAETFGNVIGFAFIEAGNNTDVVVPLDEPATTVSWAMVHVDDTEAGVYEFGEVANADGPVVLRGGVATAPFWTQPHARVNEQIVVHGDNAEMMGEMAPTVVAESVLSEGPGWLVIHADGGGQPGPVLGQTQVADGLNTDVVVELDGDVTPVVYPMLHTDTGEEGVYEFGTVDGADGPVSVDGSVVTFPVNVAPSIIISENSGLADSSVTVDGVLIDADGWLVIHASDSGSPGAVLGQTAISEGFNANVAVEVDAEAAGSEVIPMLHYDTGEAGVYEFGSVEGADAPVILGGAPVIIQLGLE
jgi:hypothetical protein